MKYYYIIEESTDKLVWYDKYHTYDKMYAINFINALKLRNKSLFYRLVKSTQY